MSARNYVWASPHSADEAGSGADLEIPPQRSGLGRRRKAKGRECQNASTKGYADGASLFFADKTSWDEDADNLNTEWTLQRAGRSIFKSRHEAMNSMRMKVWNAPRRQCSTESTHLVPKVVHQG